MVQVEKYPEVAPRISLKLIQSCENVMEHQIGSWFEEIKVHLTYRNLLDITAHSTTVLNAFCLCPIGDKDL